METDEDSVLYKTPEKHFLLSKNWMRRIKTGAVLYRDAVEIMHLKIMMI